MINGKRFKPHKMFNGLFIPVGIAMLPPTTMSYGAKVLYGKFHLSAGTKGYSYYKLVSLGESLGCSERQISHYIKQLKELGLIEVVRRGSGLNNEYYFLWNEKLLASSLSENGKELHIKNEISTGTDKQESSNTLYKNNVIDTDIRSNASNDAYMLTFVKGEIKEVAEIVKAYRIMINKQIKLFPSDVTAIERALTEFSFNELIIAIRNFSRNDWYMRCQSDNKVSWFFEDEDKILKWTDLPPTKDAEPVEFKDLLKAYNKTK